MGSGGGGGGIGASLGGIIGGYVGEGQASGDKSKAQGYAEDAMNALINIGVPPDLSKEIILQKFQEAGILSPEMEEAVSQAHSKMAELQEDPETRKAQMSALSQLQGLGKTGLGAQDRAALNQVRSEVQRDLEGKRQQILQNMQSRGMGGSGAELISQLQAAQGSANQASEAGDRIAAQAQERALQAILSSSGLAGQVRGQDYTASSNRARAEDELNRFNVQNQQNVQQRNIANRNTAQAVNLQNKQDISDRNAAQANQELMRQNDAKRQHWLDTIHRGQIQSQGYGGLSSEYGQRAANIADKKQKEYTAIGGLTEKIAKAIATYGGSEMMGMAHGGIVPGDPLIDGLDHPINDTQPIMATPGEVVIPQEIVKSEDAPNKAKEFLKSLLEQKEQPKTEEQAIKEIMFGDNKLSTVAALKEAQKRRDQEQDMADIMRYSALLGESASGIENKGLRESAKIKEERSKNQVADFEKQVEIQKKDPTSSVSKGYKNWAEQQLGIKLGGDVSASDIEPFLTSSMKKSVKQSFFQKGGVDEQGNMLVFDPKTGEFKSTGVKAADQMFQVKDPLTGQVNLVGRRAPTQGGPVVKGTFGTPKEATGQEESTHELYQTLDDKSRTKVDKTREDFLTDTAADRDAVVASGGIKQMIQAGKEINGDILRAVQNQFARANGEKGTMTEGDIKGFGGRDDITSRLARFAKMNLVGEMTDSDRKFLSDFADVMERRANDYVNQQSKVYSDNITKVTGLEDDKARTLLGVEKTMTSNRNKPSGQKVAPKDDEGKVTVEKDGKQFRLPKSQLESAKKQGYTEVK